MADEADISQARMEAEQERLLAARQWSMLPITGKCWNCEEEIEGVRFCDQFCRDDYEKQQEAKKRNGK